MRASTSATASWAAGRSPSPGSTWCPMADRNSIKRRQVVHARFERALARRELVDATAQDPVTLELARLRGIEDEAFRLVEAHAEEPHGIVDRPTAGAIARLEHALMVESAPIPTLRPPGDDLLAILENDENFGKFV